MSFDFDLNAGVLRSVFNEPVNPATLQGEALTILRCPNLHGFILSGRGPLTAPLGATLSVAISATDLVEIKAAQTLVLALKTLI